MFVWSTIILVEPLIYVFCLYFADVFINKQDISFKKKLGIFLPLLPIVILLPTEFVLQGFDLTNCYRDIAEGLIAVHYVYVLEIFYALWILLFLFEKFARTTGLLRQQVVLVSAAITMFLISLVSGNIIGSLTENWTLAQIGLFGMPLFVGFLAYLIVKFKTFNVKMIGTQALVAALAFAVLGILFIRNIENVRAVAFATLVLIIIMGYSLIRSVKHEIKQKEELAKLNVDLRESIKQRESLVHLVTHKVKGSFTRTKFIFAGLLDGTFGPITPEVQKVAKQGFDFDQGGLETVDLVLNVANLEKGIIKYDMQKVNFRELLEKTLSEKRGAIEAKGLKLETNIAEGNYQVNGDAIWLKEVIHNLLENSTKYTRQGTITVNLENKEGNKLLLTVKDTGVGITPEDEKNLFTEGGRGKESIKINVDSTGYGLYSVKLIVDAHKGRVWEHSEGLNKGSNFYVELPTI